MVGRNKSCTTGTGYKQDYLLRLSRKRLSEYLEGPRTHQVRKIDHPCILVLIGVRLDTVFAGRLADPQDSYIHAIFSRVEFLAVTTKNEKIFIKLHPATQETVFVSCHEFFFFLSLIVGLFAVCPSGPLPPLRLASDSAWHHERLAVCFEFKRQTSLPSRVISNPSSATLNS